MRSLRISSAPLVIPNREDIPFSAKVRLEEGGPAYIVRTRGEKAYFSRALEDGSTEFIVDSVTRAVYIDFDDF